MRTPTEIVTTRIPNPAGKPTDRIPKKIALGWPIQYFTDLRELLTVIRDAIKDHQIMHNHGILHRDITTENILIQPASPDCDLSLSKLVSITVGRLIDVNHAKHVEGRKDPTVIGGDINPKDMAVILEKIYVTNAVIAKAWKFFPNLCDAWLYSRSVIESNVLVSEPRGRWTPDDFGWESLGEVPDYETPAVYGRVGTIPFISHDIMLDDEASIPHSPIHDLESFWWILIYLCLTRDSGGNHRRTDITEPLQKVIKRIFEGTLIAAAKSNYFQERRGKLHFDVLLERFHDYFNPLKPMLMRWQKVLVLGYTYKAYEYHLIHKYVLAIIEDTLKSLPVTPESPVIRNELRRREKEYAFAYNINCPGDEGP